MEENAFPLRSGTAPEGHGGAQGGLRDVLGPPCGDAGELHLHNRLLDGLTNEILDVPSQ